MKVVHYFSALIALISITVSVMAFGVPSNGQSRQAQFQQTEMSRSQWLQSAFAGMVVLGTSTPAFAKDEAAVKGTKKDPAFESCLSTCMYECTKPKGVEQKSRQECLPECKAKCATTKAQLMKGTPREE